MTRSFDLRLSARWYGRAVISGRVSHGGRRRKYPGVKDMRDVRTEIPDCVKPRSELMCADDDDVDDISEQMGSEAVLCYDMLLCLPLKPCIAYG